jgi:transcriptional regulator with XRE-family HTH domain
MEKLRRLRTERGLSQARLAARAELDPSTVNQIERGAREASPATLRKLAEALDVGLAELLEDVSPKAPAPSPELPFNGFEDERREGTPSAPIAKQSAATAPMTATATAKPEEVRRILTLVWERKITPDEGTQQLLEAIA